MTNHPTVSARIVAAREAAGLNQKQLADAIDAAPSHLCRWEKGSEPKLDTLRRIAEACGCKLTDLIGE